MKGTVSCTCFICGQEFEWGHNCYHTGRKAVAWNEMLCVACDQDDGTFPSSELEAKLASKGIKPLKLENGFIVIPR